MDLWKKAMQNGADFFWEYKRRNNAITQNVNKEWRRKWSDLEGTAKSFCNELIIPPNWQPHNVFISETGLYVLVTRSKKPEVKKSTKWVCEEVLPSLRRTGKYTIGQFMKNEPMNTTHAANFQISLLLTI